MIKVEVIPPVPAAPTITISGLTQGEYQVIRNALWEYARAKDTACGDVLVPGTEKTQSQVADALHDLYIPHKGRL